MELSAAIQEALNEFGDEVSEAIHEAGKATADDLAKALKGSSPGFRNHKYLQGWGSKETESSPLKVEYVVYNRKHYQLTHLLEFGHATRNGGRARAFPHIAPVEKTAGDVMQKHLEELIG